MSSKIEFRLGTGWGLVGITKDARPIISMPGVWAVTEHGEEVVHQHTLYCVYPCTGQQLSPFKDHRVAKILGFDDEIPIWCEEERRADSEVKEGACLRKCFGLYRGGDRLLNPDVETQKVNVHPCGTITRIVPTSLYTSSVSWWRSGESGSATEVSAVLPEVAYVQALDNGDIWAFFVTHGGKKQAAQVIWSYTHSDTPDYEHLFDLGPLGSALWVSHDGHGNLYILVDTGIAYYVIYKGALRHWWNNGTMQDFGAYAERCMRKGDNTSIFQFQVINDRRRFAFLEQYKDRGVHWRCTGHSTDTSQRTTHLVPIEVPDHARAHHYWSQSGRMVERGVIKSTE